MIAISIDIDFNLFPRLGPRSDKDILLRKPDRFVAPPYSTSHRYSGIVPVPLGPISTPAPLTNRYIGSQQMI